MELSIITATIPERADMLARLKNVLASQLIGQPVEHIIVEGSGKVGEKMLAGVRRAVGRYVCVIDDDDTVADYYVNVILAELSSSPDVVTFGVQIPGSFPAFLRFGRQDNDEIVRDLVGEKYVTRYVVKSANHLCAWRREIALSSVYLPRNYGWDVVWYTSIMWRFPYLTEQHIPRVLYNYLYSPVTTRAQSPASIADSIRRKGTDKIKVFCMPDGKLAAGPSVHRVWTAGQSRSVRLTKRDAPTLLGEVVFR